MQQTTEIPKKTSLRRGRMPALLAVGVLFLFVLSACQVAVADDGTISIRPESTATGTGNGVTGNTQAGLVIQTGEVDPATVSPIDPDQVYEWNGVIEWAELEGGHFIINRGCDIWAVIPQNDEVYGKLKELNGEKGTVWGTVSFDPNIYGRRAINASTVFAPGDIRPLIALPQIPCNDTPVPGNSIAIQHSEITLHGDLVWRAGNLWLVTPRGNVRLELPALAVDLLPDLALPAAGEDSNISVTLGEYGVVGRWGLADTGLVIDVRQIKEWPHRTFVYDRCGDGKNQFQVGDSQFAARGTAVLRDGQWLLRTKSGVIIVHHNNGGNGDGVLVDPATGETSALTPDAVRGYEVVVIGDWKTDGNELHMEADSFVRVKTVCDPPQPPRPPILPGEIGALGTLVFEDGRPFLNTPSGRIVLLAQNDVPGSEPQPVDPAFFGDLPPETTDAAGVVTGEDGTANAYPDIAHRHRQILVVGKWLLYRDHLAIVVRYAIPWPQKHDHPQPYPLPLPQPEPQPAPPVLGFPVEPVLPVDVEVIEPDRRIDVAVDGVIVEPVNDKKKRLRPVGADTSANSFTAVSAR